MNLHGFNIDPGKVDFFGNNLPQNKMYDIGIHEKSTESR